uniref:Uncharacterized protein n=1 Tax=Sciurus vulgaris TaxID=55149 RepID=A0A8D2AVK4_SCIVU
LLSCRRPPLPPSSFRCGGELQVGVRVSGAMQSGWWRSLRWCPGVRQRRPQRKVWRGRLGLREALYCASSARPRRDKGLRSPGPRGSGERGSHGRVGGRKEEG